MPGIIPDHIFKQFSAYPPLSTEEECALIKKARAGDKAASDKIIMANCRYVVYYIGKYIIPPPSTTIEDMINIGIVGLIKALNAYNLEKKYKFITYAHWWVKKEILEAVQKSLSMVNVPLAQTRNMKEILTEKKEMERDGCAISVDDAIDAMCEDGKDTARRMKESFRYATSAFNVYLECELSDSASCSDSNPDDKNDRFMSTLKGHHQYEVNESHIGAEAAVEKCLKDLDKRSRQAVCMYFGIKCQPRTYKEIALVLELSGERVRQITGCAIETMRKKEEERLASLPPHLQSSLLGAIQDVSPSKEYLDS